MSSNTEGIIISVYNALRNDEELLRLLHYPPTDIAYEIPDPLDPNLQNVLDKELREYWDIVRRHILRTSKSDDWETKRMCRIYLYAGKKRGFSRNARVGKREIVVDVFVHHDYEVDFRLNRISDRLSSLLFLSRVEGGLGTVDYRDGYDFVAPKGYEAYRHIFEVGEAKWLV